MDKARPNEHMDVTHSQIDKMKAAAGLTGRQVWNRSVLKCAAYVTYRKDPELEELVRRGLMELAERQETCALYRVTEDGLKFLEQATGVKLTGAEENGSPVCARCLSWKEGTCTRGVTRLVPGEIIRCALFHEKTHGDEIRGMTDEELAEAFARRACPPKKKCQGAECFGCWIHYLRAPVGGEM